MSENPTNPQAPRTGTGSGGAEDASRDPDTPDGEGFGEPGANVERSGPAGPAPGGPERDPDDDAGMVSG